MVWNVERDRWTELELDKLDSGVDFHSPSLMVDSPGKYWVVDFHGTQLAVDSCTGD
jgi:hypothetical protein